MERTLPKLYLITDRKQLPAGKSLLEMLEECLRAGVEMVQLREKDLSAAELYPLAKDLRALTSAYHSRLLINDRVDLAQAVAADGVHLGSRSLPPRVARRILGPEALIGVSTHSPAEIKQAQQEGADFVTYGPVFFTASKACYGPPVGLTALQSICTSDSCPVYALGGVNASNLTATLNAGAYGIAVISALLSSVSPTEACRQLTDRLQMES